MHLLRVSSVHSRYVDRVSRACHFSLSGAVNYTSANYLDAWSSSQLCQNLHFQTRATDGPRRKLLGSHGLVEPGQIRGEGKHWAEEAIAWQFISGSQNLA